MKKDLNKKRALKVHFKLKDGHWWNINWSKLFRRKKDKDKYSFKSAFGE